MAGVLQTLAQFVLSLSGVTAPRSDSETSRKVWMKCSASNDCMTNSRRLQRVCFFLEVGAEYAEGPSPAISQW